MGGFFRAVTRIFRKPQAVVVQQAPVQQVAQTAKSQTRKLNIGEGMADTGTLLTEATGIEEEANVSKTVLGGTINKKKKKA